MRAKIVQSILPFCSFILLAVLSLIAPIGQYGSEWMPIIGGADNTGILDRWFVSVPLVLLSLAAIFSGLYCVLLKTNAIKFKQTIMILLLLMAANPGWLRFNAIYPVMACIIWFQYCLLTSQIFASFLILSLASLFYAPAIWMVLAFILLLPVSGMPDLLRVLVKSLSGASVPHLYLLVFRWIIFDDAGVYLYHYANRITDIGTPFHLIGIPQYFMLLLLLYLVVRAFSLFMSKSPKGILEYLLRMEFATMLSAIVLVVLFYDNQNATLFSIFLLPLSVVIGYYFRNCGNTSRTNMEFLLLVCTLLICSISHLTL